MKQVRGGAVTKATYDPQYLADRPFWPPKAVYRLFQKIHTQLLAMSLAERHREDMEMGSYHRTKI